AVQASEHYQVDVWCSNAPMNRAILNMPNVSQRRLQSLVFNPATSFCIPVTAELADEWQALTGCQMNESSYGLSETHTIDTAMPRGAIRWGSCGKADRKSTRLNSSHVSISYAVFCLKKKKQRNCA